MKILSFIIGLIIGLFIIPLAAYCYFAGGYAPVATSSPPMPFEQMLAHKALHARLAKAKLNPCPIPLNASNLLAGITVYKQNCAVCHGWPGQPKTTVAAGMFPRPPQVFHGKGVTDDTPAETHWKAANGIRLTGMPGFQNTLSDKALWQVSLLLANATNHFSDPVEAALSPTNGPADARGAGKN